MSAANGSHSLRQNGQSLQSQASTQLRILTLNVWGLKYVSRLRQERIRAIAEYICQPEPSSSNSPTSSTASQDSGIGEGTPLQPVSPQSRGKRRLDTEAAHSAQHSRAVDPAARRPPRWDVVCLQEVWCSEDWEYLQTRARESGSGLVHGRYFYSGALGSGLCVLSRFPIVATSTWPYSMSGSPLHVIEGDFYVAKACGQATLDLSSMGEGMGNLTVLNTHFFAPGGDWGDEWKRSHRLAQAWELARLANIAAERGQHVVVCGDMNSQPTSLVMNLLLSHGRLTDSWIVTHPQASQPNVSSAPTAQEAITVNGMTCDNPLNTWSAGKRFGDDIIRQKGKRLDYVLYRRPDRYRAEKKRAMLATQCEVTATEEVRSLGCSLSDHFGVEAVLTFPRTDELEDDSDELIPERPSSAETIRLALAAIAIYSGRSMSASKAQLGLFCLSLIGIPALGVAASFQPIRWLNWIFVLLGIGTGAGGATMLYTGFVGGRWETSAIKNTLSDMSVELERLESIGGR